MRSLKIGFGAGLVILSFFSCRQRVSKPPDVIIFPGAIAVFTSPPGATIYLDSVHTGLVSPDTIMDVPPGNYTITLKLHTYNDTTLPVHVQSNVVSILNVALVSEYGTIIVDSDPRGALIYVDYRLSGTTPDTLTYVLPDTYRVELKLEGYVDYPRQVTIAEGQTKYLYFDWSVLGYGSFFFNTFPSGARIWLDGSRLSSRTPLQQDLIPAGSHGIEYELSGYLISRIDTFLSGGRFLRIEDTLSPVEVTFNSNPSGAKLYLDGTYHGLTPQTLSGVIAEGNHQIKLSKLGTQDFIQDLYLQHQDTLYIDLTILFGVLFYDDFNRSPGLIAGDWSIYQDQWQEWPLGDKEPFQTEAYCLALPPGGQSCGYLILKDSLYIEPSLACSLLVRQYDNTGFLLALANGEPLAGISSDPNSISRASLDQYMGKKIQLSFYGCPTVYIDNVLVARY